MFCPKCGKPITPETKFCPSCGQIIQNMQSQPKPTIVPHHPVSSSNINIPDPTVQTPLPPDNNQSKILPVVIVGIILIASGGLFWFNKDTLADKMRSLDIAVSLADKISPRKPSIAKNQSPSSTEPATDKNKESKSSSSESIQHMQAGQILAKEFGLSGDKILATSYGNSENGFLALQNGKLYLVDRKNHRIAFIDIQTDTFSHIQKCVNQPRTSSSVVVYFHVQNDTHDQDTEAGAWENSMHIIPIFIDFKVNPDGTIAPGMLTTGKGARPRHLQAYLYEQKNVDLGNLFITESPTFINDAMHNGINL